MVIRKFLPIKQKANYFQFNHKSISEHLFATFVIDFLKQINLLNFQQQLIELRKEKYMFEQIKDIDKIDKDLFNILYNSPLNQYINLNVSQIYDLMRFLKAGIQFHNLQNTCYLLSLLSSIRPSLIRLSSNALYLYTNLLINVDNKDFRGIWVEKISLNGIKFSNCDFSQSKLEKVSINGIGLNQCDLSNSSWIDCYSNDLLSFRTIYSRIKCICYSNVEEQFIISGNENWTFSLWDKKEAKLLKHFITDKPHCQLVDIIPIYNGQEIQFAIFYDVSYLTQGAPKLRIDFVKIKDINTLVSLNDIQIDCDCYKKNLIQSFSLNNNFLIYKKEYEICAYDLNTQETYKKKFLNKIIYSQIKDDNNLVYIIFHEFIEDICVWNISDDVQKRIRFQKIKEIMELSLGQGDKLNFKFSRNFQLLAMATLKDFYLFNLEINEYIQCQFQGVQVIEFSKNQQYLGIGGNFLIVYHIQKQYIIQKLYGSDSITSIIFDSSQTEIITLSKDGLVQYWDVQQCFQNTQLLSENYKFLIDQMQYSQNGKLIFIQINHQIQIYSSDTGLQIDFVEITVDMFKSSPIKDELFFKQQGKWYCYNYFFKLKTEIEVSSQNNLIISQDGRLICTSSDCEFQIIQIDHNNKILFTSVQFIGLYPCFSKDSQTVYFYKQSQLDSILCMINPNTGIYQFQCSTEIMDLDGVIHNIQLSSDNKNIFIFNGQNVQMFNIQGKQMVDQMNMKLNSFKMAFSLNDKHIFLCTQSAIKILNSQTFQQIGEDLQGHNPYTKQLIVNPNGEQFISLGEDNNIKIWEIDKHFIQDLQRNPYQLKQTIPQKSSQNVNIHDTKMQNAKIISHLGYNIQDIWINQFSNFKLDNQYKI